VLRSIRSAPIATPGGCCCGSSRSERLRGRAAALADVSAGEVRAFLHHTEHGRKTTIGTRNCRLAAIRSFFSFVADKDPEYVAQCSEVLTVPLKREPTSAPCYLEPSEVEAILAQPDRRHSRDARPCVALVPVQQRRADPGGARSVFRAIRFDAPNCAPLWQGAQGTDLSALAGNRDVAQEVAGTPAACARRADLRQSIR
jgi:hypothetical protein